MNSCTCVSATQHKNTKCPYEYITYLQRKLNVLDRKTSKGYTPKTPKELVEVRGD